MYEVKPFYMMISLKIEWSLSISRGWYIYNCDLWARLWVKNKYKPNYLEMTKEYEDSFFP